MKTPFLRPLFLAAALALAATASHAGPVLYVSTFIGHESGELGTVDATSGETRRIGGLSKVMTDIAFDPWGQLWGIDGGNLYRIDRNTAGVTTVGPLGSTNGFANSLVFGSNGELYMAGTSLYRVDTATGQATGIGNIGAQSGGDLAFVNGGLYMSTNGGQLLRLDTSTGAGTNIGDIGYSSVFGLASPDGANLYGLSGEQVLRINTFTGQGTLSTAYQPHGSLQGVAWGSAFLSEAGAAVPTPATLALVALGLGALAFTRRQRR